MDCSKARSPIEKAICADPAANAADDAMSASFSGLKKSQTVEQWNVLLAKQRLWLKGREYRCYEKKGAALSACLKADTEAWTATLEGRPEAGTYDATAFAPLIAGKIAKRNGEYDISIMVMKFRTPQTVAERAFNAAVDAQIKDAPMNEPREADMPRKLAYDASMRVSFASPALISAATEVYQDGGGAHPNTNTFHINIDGRSGKEVTLADVFTADGRKTALKLCATQISAQRKEKGADQVAESGKNDSANSSLADAFGAIANWSFGRDKTSVYFNPYELGSYAEGAYGCDFQNTELRPLIKPGFPLPN